jgi:hypothetical protein
MFYKVRSKAGQADLCESNRAETALGIRGGMGQEETGRILGDGNVPCREGAMGHPGVFVCQAHLLCAQDLHIHLCITDNTQATQCDTIKDMISCNIAHN